MSSWGEVEKEWILYSDDVMKILNLKSYQNIKTKTEYNTNQFVANRTRKKTKKAMKGGKDNKKKTERKKKKPSEKKKRKLNKIRDEKKENKRKRGNKKKKTSHRNYIFLQYIWFENKKR